MMNKKKKGSLELEHFEALKLTGSGRRRRIEFPKELVEKLNLRLGEGVDLWIDPRSRRLVYDPKLLGFTLGKRSYRVLVLIDFDSQKPIRSPSKD
jgi:hypothetical protein